MKVDVPISNSPMTNSNISNTASQLTPERVGFIKGLTSLFGFRKRNASSRLSTKNLQFVRVDQESELKIAQAKLGKVLGGKLTGKVEELMNSWLADTTDTYRTLEDRVKRLSELEFAIANDPFLSTAADLYADEATQIDVQGKLINIDCSDIRMKERMEDLLEQWGITQNRLRSVAYQLAAFGDAFWANKVTKNGVVRINPIGIHQVKERLEFDPVQVKTDLSLQKGYITAINRSAKLQKLFQDIESSEYDAFADMFDTRLFGFALDDDLVVPPWSITHFRLNADQSEFFPMGRSFFLKALAPFRQCNATMVLQSLARVTSFPVTVYNVKTPPGMDEAQQFEKINEVREEYENIGDSGAGNEAYSVNTKIWAPEGLLSVEMHTPNIDLNTIGDIEMYQDRIAIASGIPKGYLVQEWGGFGNSAISLVEQFKPFARRVFTVQSAILDGLSNLFRLHFAITGEFDYREPFILSMKFPNEEASDARTQAKSASLELSKGVMDTIANVVGSLNDPLPPEVIKDILTKYSFLDPKDIEKWVKDNPNKVQSSEGEGGAEEFGGDFGGGGGFGGDFSGESGFEDFGGGEEGGFEGENFGGEEGAGDETMGGEEEALSGPEMEDSFEKEENYRNYRNKNPILREKVIKRRYLEAKDTIYEEVIKNFARVDEAKANGRHYKYAILESCMIPTYDLFTDSEGKKSQSSKLTEETLSWTHIKEIMREEDETDK